MPAPSYTQTLVLTFSLEDAVEKLPFVVGSVRPLVLALAVLLTLYVVALELNAALAPSLLAEAVLQVVPPFAFVG